MEANPDKLLMGAQYCRALLSLTGKAQTKVGGSMKICKFHW